MKVVCYCPDLVEVLVGRVSLVAATLRHWLQVEQEELHAGEHGRVLGTHGRENEGGGQFLETTMGLATAWHPCWLLLAIVSNCQLLLVPRGNQEVDGSHHQ